MIPPKRSEHTSWIGGSALGDDGRFLAVFNLTPTTSLSIVDVAERRFVAEVETPGCSLVYAAGPRRFLSLCADGTALVLALDESGGAPSKAKTERFFDPQADPVTEKAVRRGDEWLFVSFEGVVHAVDVSGPALRFAETWSLVDEAERGAAGASAARSTSRSTRRADASTRWCTRAGRTRTRIPARSCGSTISRKRKRVQRSSCAIRPRACVMDQTKTQPGGALDWLFQMRAARTHGIERILVTQDAAPLLLRRVELPGDARGLRRDAAGAHLRDVSELGIATSLIQLP